MKFFLFLISFSKLRNFFFVLVLLLIGTFLEYLFVVLVPYFFQAVLNEQNEFLNYFNNFGFFEQSEIFKIIL